MSVEEKKIYTSEDYWKNGDKERAELIYGDLVAMAPPSLTHQRIVHHLSRVIGQYIVDNKGECQILQAPFAVNIDAKDENWVEPDVFVVCDRSKLTERACVGAPDLVIEVVSPSSRRMDYAVKMQLYLDSGVREYWIVDPSKKITLVFRFGSDISPAITSFDKELSVGIFPDLSIKISELLEL